MLFLKSLSTLIHTVGVMAVGGFLVYIYMTSNFESPSLAYEIKEYTNIFKEFSESIAKLPGEISIMLDDINEMPDNMQKIRDNVDEMRNGY